MPCFFASRWSSTAPASEPWSVSVTAGISSSAARAASAGIRHAPSRIEYSEWTWRWTKGASDTGGPSYYRVRTAPWARDPGSVSHASALAEGTGFSLSRAFSPAHAGATEACRTRAGLLGGRRVALRADLLDDEDLLLFPAAALLRLPDGKGAAGGPDHGHDLRSPLLSFFRSARVLRRYRASRLHLGDALD